MSLERKIADHATGAATVYFLLTRWRWVVYLALLLAVLGLAMVGRAFDPPTSPATAETSSTAHR